MSYETNDKMVSHPDHYKSGKYEVIDIIDEFCKDLTGTEAVCTANAIKYILRWKKKNGVQDLKKAVWYLMHMIDRFADAEREDHAKFDEWRLTKGDSGSLTLDDAKNLEAYIKNDAKLAGETFTPTIDDEPAPLNLRKNAAGVYIPQDKSTSEKIKRQLDGSKFGMASALDDFMNPPYEELMKQCKEYYKAAENLKKLFDDAVANINLLENDRNKLSEENDAILEDYKTTLKTISNRLSTGSLYSKKEIREWVDKKLEDIKNGRT